MFEIDHIIVCVADLEEASNWFLESHGLASVPGGRHPGHGTANRIIPLGETYLEVVAVLDSTEASRSVFGRWVAGRNPPPIAADALVIRTDDIEADSSALGLAAVPMSRQKPDGSTLSWRFAGVEKMIEEGHPAVIEWEVPEDQLPGRIALEHPAGPAHLGSVTVHSKTRLPLKVPGVTFEIGANGAAAEIVTGRGVFVL